MLHLPLAMSSPTCEENAVVGHCMLKGCFMGHGSASCHGTQCICDPGTCSMDGKTCVTTPTTTTTTTAIPLQEGQVIKLHLADSTSPNAWFSFTASNNEA